MRSNTDVATMEAANETARRAVNAILDREQVAAPRCAIYELYYPSSGTAKPARAAMGASSSERFRRGLPWVPPFDLRCAQHRALVVIRPAFRGRSASNERAGEVDSDPNHR
jgi:hypothetical protein